MTKQKLTPKEKKIFFAALVAGVGGGYIANIAVTAMYRYIYTDRSLLSVITFVLSTLIFFGLILYMFNKIKD